MTARKVKCDDCGLAEVQAMTKAEWEAYKAEEWIWLCANCYCEGDGEQATVDE